jgi:hypothetical protein
MRAFASSGDDSGAPWWLLEPLTPGVSVGAGWRVLDLSPVRAGAAVLRIRNPLHGTLAIHICGHRGSPRGYAHTELFDLIVMDGGHGRRVVPKERAAVFAHIADRIRSNELRGDPDAHHSDLQRVMTHRERVQTFGPTQLQEVP